MARLNPQEADIRRTLLRVGRELGSKVKFAKRRRNTDLVVATFHGRRFRVLQIPLRVAEELEGWDVEILRGRAIKGRYLLMLVVTERLEAQERRPDHERRGKLRMAELEPSEST